MRIILTGSSGRVGRAIVNALAPQHEVIGIDRSPFSTTRITADFADVALLTKAMDGADAVIHTAALHAPHVGVVPDSEFNRINVEGTRLIIEAAQAAKVRRLVFTSTTALFGKSVEDGTAAWVTDDTVPQPRSIYHHTKLAAEALLQQAANDELAVRVIRMSRCFPEEANLMALYRMARGIDVRDVASAHMAALTNRGPAYQRYIISGVTPFKPDDCQRLVSDPGAVLWERAPTLMRAFQDRGWPLPTSIDRVYAGTEARIHLGWQPHYGFEEVLAQLDRGSLEVLPVGAITMQRNE
ncbi:NAD(P)-dependent oxidoreductase [Fibrella sp. HMF5335]|uniref:NAD(P)-dependent oxidoreductase n=1 Tax=Fibrella rubiginis TaxID=2817060 RepID=A0A939K3P4_9BACT|nr:NAD(P)-dependent oxidoreductase [Fibrella rubiginis]MBO0939472.1 NAD(P)-dependent oxidoreductase [Fibrella rubiginis]